tara:strand:+ start:898 stop:1293 length:396 start_codon:yes stop_codon:yes gene_type:complete
MELKEVLKEIYKKAKENYQFENTPKLILRQDQDNADNVLGQTAYYNPSNMTIVLFITDRHPKDICRSFSHELVHHHQNERGDLEMGNASSPTYAQDDKHMRKMEMEAYLKGNMLFRDWEDWFKNYRNTNKK